MGKKKVTKMLLKVDLQCSKCYKKVRKALCKFPHVRDQVYDEKANTVTIKVVCCSPEKIMDKIRSEGGASIESIKIEKRVTFVDFLNQTELIPPSPKRLKEPPPPQRLEEPPPPQRLEEPPPPQKLKEPEKPPVQSIVLPAPGYPQTCYTELHQGPDGVPYNQMCDGQPVRYYDGYCGRPVYDSWGGGEGYMPSYAARSYGECFSDENLSACSIM